MPCEALVVMGDVNISPEDCDIGIGADNAKAIWEHLCSKTSATSASHGISLWSIMVFPVLFAVGMALIDSLDNFVMIGAG